MNASFALISQQSSLIHVFTVPTDLAFNQNSVPAIVDKTALYLVGATAAPISQYLVDRSNLQIKEANITFVSLNLQPDRH
jgi:hypothetical protein